MQERNKKVIIFAFWSLIVFAIISIAITFYMYPNHFNVKNIKKTIEPVTINFETTQKNPTVNFLTCYNDYCISANSDLFNNTYTYIFDNQDINFYDFKVKNLKIIYPKEYKNIGIDKIILSVGNKNYYYNKEDISKFKKKDLSIKIFEHDRNEEYTALILPEVSNYNGVLNKVIILFLSLFSNWIIFCIPYFWLFVAFLIYVFNKDCFNFKFSDKMYLPIFIFILFLASLFRIQNISYFPLDTTELYSNTIAISSIKTVFQDFYNLPLFYLLQFLLVKIFSINIFSARILPLLFSIAFIPMVYLIFKDISKNIAVFASFLASINVIFIYYAQESQVYSMSMFLSLCAIYFLFKYLKNPNNKNLTFYGIICIFLMNSSIYSAILVISNLLWGVIDLFENKNKGKTIPYILTNFVCIATILPYLILSKQETNMHSLNYIITSLNKDVFKNIIDTYFLNKYIFLFLCIIVLINLVPCFIPKVKLNKEKENLFIYLAYTLTFIVIIASAISILFKPIAHETMLLNIYGLLFIFEILIITSIFDFNERNKIYTSAKAAYSVIMLVLYFSVTSCNIKSFESIDYLMFIIKNEAPYYQSLGYEIHGLIPDHTEYVKAYPQIEKLNYINWHEVNSKTFNIQTDMKIKKYTKSKNNVVIFANEPANNISLFNINPNIRFYNSNSTSCAKLETKGK